MNLDRAEELLLVLIAACMLSFLLPFSLLRGIAATLLIAIALIVLLLLRGVSWHRQHATPFDGVLVLGVLLTVVYLASFSAFQRSALSSAVVLLFAAFYAVLAFLLYEHRWLFRKKRKSDGARVHEVHIEPIHEIRLPRPGKVHGSEFKRGLEPLPDVTAEHLHKLGVYDTEAKRRSI